MATTIQVVVDPKLKRELKAIAKSEDRTLSNFAGRLLEAAFQQYKSKLETTVEVA